MPATIIFLALFNERYQKWGNPFECENNFASILVGSAFPLLLTIISISISLPEEEICGVKKKDFSNARRGLHFSMLSMIVCSILLMAAFDVSYWFDDWPTAAAADALCAFFSLLFGYLEIPLLVKDEKTIFRNVKKMTSDDSDEVSRAIGIKAVRYMILDEDIGLKKTLDNTWDKKHGTKVDYLVQLQTWQRESLEEEADASGFRKEEGGEAHE